MLRKKLPKAFKFSENAKFFESFLEQESSLAQVSIRNKNVCFALFSFYKTILLLPCIPEFL